MYHAMTVSGHVFVCLWNRGHCIVCRSIYRFWLPFGIFKLFLTVASNLLQYIFYRSMTKNTTLILPV
jgi:hypothetical protein